MSVAPLPDQPQVVRITPELAADWLSNRNLAESRATNNRTMSKHIVGKYAESMAEGRWLLTHQGIAFDQDGWLIDGQHRLAAVVQSGMTIQMMVVPDCDPRTFSVLDTGFKRQVAHLIPVNGFVVAAAARVLGTVTGAWPSRATQGGVYDSQATNDQVFEMVEAWQKELDSLAPVVTNCYVKTRVNKGFHLAVLAQAARSTYSERIESWIEGLNTGENLDRDDPRLHLRNRFLRDFRSLNAGSSRPSAYRLIVRAWNAYATGRPMALLRAREDLPAPEVVT